VLSGSPVHRHPLHQFIGLGNSGIVTMVGVHMHPTVGSGTCNTLVSDYNIPASNALT
jgi:hypothetical protein